MLYEEGTILYFTPFIFEDGSTPKPKYLIVIRNLEEAMLLASLPTSKDHIPSKIEKKHGCIDMPEINFNCYYFQAGKIVTADGEKSFAFPKDTYIYGFRLAIFDRNVFTVQESKHLTCIEIKGRLNASEFKNLIECLKNSVSVKRKFRRML